MAVNDSEPAPEASASTPYGGILAECCRIVRERTGNALAALQPVVILDIEEMHRATYDAVRSDMIAELLRALRMHGFSLPREFDLAFERLWRERARGRRRSDRMYQTDTLPDIELALIDDRIFSETLAIRAQAAVLRNACEAELRELLPRLAVMISGGHELDEACNPLGPAAIAEALKHACWAVDCSLEAREILYALLARKLADDLSSTYGQVGKLLAERRVLPRLRPAIQRGGGRNITRRAQATPADAAEVLKQLLAPAGSGPADTLPHSGRFGNVRPDGNLPAVLNTLGRLQRGERQIEVGGQTLQFDPGAAETMNILRSLLDAGIGKQLGALDGIVIDVVATLFDFIFEDERVPSVMKALIGRLQLPVLKLALTDHAFFSNRQHPARRLINVLAEAASTWDGELNTESSLYQIAEPLVARIHDTGGEDTTAFADSLDTLQAFLSEQERVAEEKAAPLASQLGSREVLEIARSIATDAVAPHVADPALPQALRDMLRARWSIVLTEAARNGGENGEAWLAAIGTMEDLVWSVRPKTNAKDRQRLVGLLPGLLARVQAGLETSGMPASHRHVFFSDLVKLHAAAVKNGMLPAVNTVDPAPPAVQPQAQFVPQDGLDDLRRGDWLELKLESGKRCAVRLTWISPARTMFLFSNRQGVRAIALTRAELARRFDREEALLIDDEPLMDRLVSNVLNEYQPDAEGSPR